MSFIGNIAAAETAKRIGDYNQKIIHHEAAYEKRKAEIAEKVYQEVERPRLLDIQDAEYANFFVSTLSSGAEFREGDTTFLAALKSKQNQALDLALSDYNSKVTVNDMLNQSLLLRARGDLERYKGRLTARAKYMEAAGSLLSMGYQSKQQGRLVIV